MVNIIWYGVKQMSREFKPSEVEELIKQAFRLAPRNHFRDNDTFPSDIDSAIGFVRAAANTGSDYFARLVVEARSRAEKAMRRYPQPNYVISKVAEESGELVKASIHYAEGRESWLNVENEAIDAIAMIYRLMTEGDQVHGFTPPPFLKGE